MHEIAYLVGGTIGAGLDPLTWLPAALAVFAMSRAWPIRLAVALAVNVVLGFLFFAAVTKSLPTEQAVWFSALATAVWFAIFMGIRSLLNRRNAAGGAGQR